jgi:hypothetical protein
VGGDPDVVWAGEIMRSVPLTVSCQQHPANIGEEMAAHDLEIVAVVDEESPVGVAWPRHPGGCHPGSEGTAAT